MVDARIFIPPWAPGWVTVIGTLLLTTVTLTVRAAEAVPPKKSGIDIINKKIFLINFRRKIEILLSVKKP